MRILVVTGLALTLLGGCGANQVDNPQLEAAANKVLLDHGIYADTSRLSGGRLGAIVSIGNSSRDYGSRRGLLQGLATRSGAGSICVPGTDDCLIPSDWADAPPVTAAPVSR